MDVLWLIAESPTPVAPEIGVVKAPAVGTGVDETFLCFLCMEEQELLAFLRPVSVEEALRL